MTDEPLPEHDHGKGIITTYVEMLALKNALDAANEIVNKIAFDTEEKGAMSREKTGKEAMYLFKRYMDSNEKYFGLYHEEFMEAWPVLIAGLWLARAQVDGFLEANPQWTGNTGAEVG